MTLLMIAYVMVTIGGGVAFVSQVVSKAPPKRRLAAMIPSLLVSMLGLNRIASEATGPVSEACLWASGVALGIMIGAVIAFRMLARNSAGGVTQ